MAHQKLAGFFLQYIFALSETNVLFSQISPVTLTMNCIHVADVGKL